LTTANDIRTQDIATIAALLARRNGQLGRLLYRLSGTSLPRGMASLLAALADGPQPLTKLAEREGLAQPTVTRIVRRLEALELVRRDSDPADARIALVSITAAGETALEDVRARYAAALSEGLAHISKAELKRVAAATDVLETIISALQARR
jgi:DNA-binding MarR family transcriptional regulator